MVDLRKKYPLEKNEHPARRSNKEQGLDQAIKIRKGVERKPIAVGVEVRVLICLLRRYHRVTYYYRNPLDRCRT